MNMQITQINYKSWKLIEISFDEQLLILMDQPFQNTKNYLNEMVSEGTLEQKGVLTWLLLFVL